MEQLVNDYIVEADVKNFIEISILCKTPLLLHGAY